MPPTTNRPNASAQRANNDRTINNAFAGEVGRKTGLKLARRPIDEKTGLESTKGLFTPTPRRPVPKPKSPAIPRHVQQEEREDRRTSLGSNRSASMEIEESALTPADYKRGRRSQLQTHSSKKSIPSQQASQKSTPQESFTRPHSLVSTALKPTSTRKTPATSSRHLDFEKIQQSVEVSPGKTRRSSALRSAHPTPNVRKSVYDPPYSPEPLAEETPSRHQPIAVQAREARKSLGRRDRYPLHVADQTDDELGKPQLEQASSQQIDQDRDVNEADHGQETVDDREEQQDAAALPTPEDTHSSAAADASQPVAKSRHSIPGPVFSDDLGPAEADMEVDVGERFDDAPINIGEDDYEPMEEDVSIDHQMANIHSDPNLDPTLKNEHLNPDTEENTHSEEIPEAESIDAMQAEEAEESFGAPEDVPVEEPAEEPAEREPSPPAKTKKKGRPAKATKTKARAALSSKDPNKAPHRATTGSPKSRHVRGNTRQRTETPGPEASHQTRSGRVVIPPLEYWKGERIVRTAERDPTSNAVMSSISQIVRFDDVTPVKRTRGVSEGARKRRKGSRAKSRANSSDESDASDGEEYLRRQKDAVEDLTQDLEEWEIESGLQTGPVRVWDPSLQTTHPDVYEQEELAFSALGINPKQVPAAHFKFCKLLSTSYFGCGMVELPKNGEKRFKNSRKMHMAFFLHTGKVQVEVCENRWVLSAGGCWQVPRGNFYSITNMSNKTARIFFAQGNEVEISGFTNIIDHPGDEVNGHSPPAEQADAAGTEAIAQ